MCLRPKRIEEKVPATTAVAQDDEFHGEASAETFRYARLAT